MGHLKKGNCKSTEADQFVIYRHSSEGELWEAIKVDEFTVFGSRTPCVYAFYTNMAIKCKVKRLGGPSQFLGWIIRTKPDGNICLSQPEITQVTIEAPRMMGANARATPYVDGVEMNGPESTEKAGQKQGVLQESLVGDFRYLVN